MEKYNLVFDAGTTTIKAHLVSANEKIIFSKEELNNQYIYGSDVISRVTSAHFKGIKGLQETILGQLKSLILFFSEKYFIERIIITGNSVILSTINGMDLSGFERHPFTSPSSFDFSFPLTRWFQTDDIPENIKTAEVYFPPIVDAFLGADVVTCAYHIAAIAEDFPVLIADIGTNGEITILDRDSSEKTASRGFKLYGCSCAAGPAFEGKKLSTSMTGSEAIEALDNMLKSGQMDTTGCLLAKNTVLNQQDIRQMQLAKGAVIAAIETLMLKSGYKENYIKALYISGNFGNALNSKAITDIGLVPECFENRISYAGNSAALGAVDLISKENWKTELRDFVKEHKTIQLAGDNDFTRRYIKGINFK